MTTFTELVAAVVVHSSAAAYSHFGVTLEPVRAEHPTPIERTVARTAPKKVEKTGAEKTAECPLPRARLLKT
jgi:hypothetical protein